jgi:hypothetical protein
LLSKAAKPSLDADTIKSGIAGLIGGAAAFGAGFVLLQRTNAKEFPKATRLSFGIVAAVAGMAALVSLEGFLQGLIGGGMWFQNSMMLSAMAVYGGVGFVALNKHGALSGWTAPPPSAAAFGGGMPPQGGYPPQQGGGYPPQQGGGYPPQQGGGYPPQGGGYPPQGGGGLPPPSGGYPPGGYPPR